MDNKAKPSNIVNALRRELTDRLPSGWRILQERAGELVLKIRAPRGKTGSLWVQTSDRLEPKEADLLAAKLRPADRASVLIVAPYISPRTQEVLKANGIGYADLTGNFHFSLPEPGLFVQTTGAAQDPFSERRERKSLRGAKAGRLVRALCDFRPPTGLRELAKRAGIDAGYASRLIDFLNREALITRDHRGAIIRSEWANLIRQWTEAYSPFERGRARWYLAARGMPQVLEGIQRLTIRYAISGSWAAAQYAPVSPTRLLLCYADDPEALARRLDLREAEAGANVALAAPFNPVVYDRTSERNGITIVSASQIAADLLSSPGRGPNEAEALMAWMQENEDAWRH